MNENNKTIANALSLRTPQRESLDLLEQIVQKIDLKPDADLKEALAAIHEIAPKIEDLNENFLLSALPWQPVSVKPASWERLSLTCIWKRESRIFSFWLQI